MSNMSPIINGLESISKALNTNAVSKPANTDAPAQSFSSLIGDSVNRVNQTMKTAETTSNAFLRDEPGANLVDTMLAVNKAQVEFRMAVEVRNRLIKTYETISNMSI
jgi:flagellar hook-basal body complex protein FliE